MTPALAGAAVLLLMAFVNLRLGGSILYPPAQFSLLWAALVTASVVWGGTYFPLSVDAVGVFCAGAFAFSAGGALRLLIHQNSPAPEQASAPEASRALRWYLAGGLILLVSLLPVFWSYVLSAADPRFQNVWWGIRSGMLRLAEVQGQKPWEQVLLDNLMVFAILLAFTAVACCGERFGSKAVALALVLVATAYQLATASRSGAVTVLFGALGIMMIRRGRLLPRHVVAGVVAVLVMFVPMTVLRMRTGNVANDLRTVGDLGLLYTVGPLTSFDEYLRNPSALPETWSISHSLLHVANRMGFDVNAPSQHLAYVDVGAPWPSNVYTMYLAYYSEFGWLGVVFLPALLGYGTVWIYRAAAERRGYLLILYGMVFAEISKSGFAEGFFMGLNMWIKAALYCLGLYALLGAGRKSPAARPEPTPLPMVHSC